MSGFSNAYCPTKKCTVPNFISLAACATCTEESISEEYFDTCIYELSHLENATKTFTNFTNAQDMREYLRTNPEYLEIHVMCTKGFPQFPRFTVELSIRDGASSLLHIENAVGEKQESTSTDQGVTIASKGTYLQSCASASHVVEEKSTKIVGQTCFKSTTDLALYNITDHIGQINGTVSNCRLDFCAKKYENILIVRGEMPSQSTTDILLELQNRSAPENSTDDVWQVKESQDFGLIDFKVGAMSRGLLTIAVEDMFDDWMIRRCLYYVDISRTASFGNWTQRFYHLADILSVIIQATTNPNATNVTGQAYEDEIYVHIHWGWIIMPISIVVISGLFLTLTIVESGKKSYLFKTSIIAVLFHGLDGWNVSNLPTPTKMNKETSEGLAKESEGIVVMLKENNENNLKLVKV
jgi:hypothetical protein